MVKSQLLVVLGISYFLFSICGEKEKGCLRFAPSVDVSLSSYHSRSPFLSLRYETLHKTSLFKSKPTSLTYQMDAPGADGKNIRSRQEDPFSWLIKESA
jgi:hypothetical protein